MERTCYVSPPVLVGSFVSAQRQACLTVIAPGREHHGLPTKCARHARVRMSLARILSERIRHGLGLKRTNSDERKAGEHSDVADEKNRKEADSKVRAKGNQTEAVREAGDEDGENGAISTTDGGGGASRNADKKAPKGLMLLDALTEIEELLGNVPKRTSDSVAGLADEARNSTKSLTDTYASSVASVRRGLQNLPSAVLKSLKSETVAQRLQVVLQGLSDIPRFPAVGTGVSDREGSDIEGKELSSGSLRPKNIAPLYTRTQSAKPVMQDATMDLTESEKTSDDADDEAFVRAVAVAMEAVGLGLESVGEGRTEDADFSVPIPSEPDFDAANALILAGYAFRSYLEPPRGSYWEQYTASVPGSNVSGIEKQNVYTKLAYSSTDAISAFAKGVVMAQAERPTTDDDVEKVLPAGLYFVACLEENALFEDALSGDSTSFTLLSKAEGKAEGKADEELAKKSNLALFAFSSKSSFARGNPPIAVARMDLDDVIDEASAKGLPAESGRRLLPLEMLSDEERSKNFFFFDLLPDGLELPFGIPDFTGGVLGGSSTELAGCSVALRVTYVPFSADDGADAFHDFDDDDDDCEDDDELEPDDEFDRSSAEAISKKLAEGVMPREWLRLSRELGQIVKELPEHTGGAPLVEPDIQNGVFLESVGTDSQVWIWHEPSSKHIVVSFRGTEQVKWQDFFTDALAFLQAWKPGDEIILDIQEGRTLGLDIWDVLLNGSKKGQDDDVSGMSCVHWGFLRAYFSVRDALEHVLSNMTNNFADEDYQLYFTGHSLGGALATLAAADLQARFGGPAHKLSITMMNFGSPRVGNRAFARIFNELVPDAFRVVNGADLIARMPRTPSGLRGGYHHVGRIVAVTEAGRVWVEGGVNEIDSPFPASFEDIQDLIRHERMMWSMLISGQSLGHHLEDSYYVSMRNAVSNLVASQRNA